MKRGGYMKIKNEYKNMNINICSLSDKQLLQDLLDSDIMNSDVVKQQLKMLKRDKVLGIHEYTITNTQGVDSRWQTYVKQEGKRKKVSAYSEEGLYDKLYDFYFQKNITLEMIYPQWLKKRRTANVNARTIKRNQNHWDKYYLNHKIIQIPVVKITIDILEDFFHECIKKYSLTVKELNNMKFIIKDMLKMSLRNGYIVSNPFNDIEINTNACQPASKANDISRVYTADEQERFFLALNHEILHIPENTDSYAICLLFKLGLRIGELCALQWGDIDNETNEIHIHRMETQDEDLNGVLHPVVVPYTKKKSTYGDRFLPLSEYECDILEKVKIINHEYGYKEDDFIFCDENGRTKIREIDHRIRKLCNKADILPVKSAHDIRRTVATQMHMEGIPIRIIQEFLGHSDTKTTWGYIVNNQEKAILHTKIRDALVNLNGLNKAKG
jgi:integrase